jgi:streptogrisin C
MKRIVAIAVGGIAVVVVALTLSPIASAAPSPHRGAAGHDVPAALLSAMQRDLHLDPAQTRARLDLERTARSTEVGLSARLGASYGGAWLTDDGRLVVGVTDARRMSLARAMGAEPKLVPHSKVTAPVPAGHHSGSLSSGDQPTVVAGAKRRR